MLGGCCRCSARSSRPALPARPGSAPPACSPRGSGSCPARCRCVRRHRIRTAPLTHHNCPIFEAWWAADLRPAADVRFSHPIALASASGGGGTSSSASAKRPEPGALSADSTYRQLVGIWSAELITVNYHSNRRIPASGVPNFGTWSAYHLHNCIQLYVNRSGTWSAGRWHLRCRRAGAVSGRPRVPIGKIETTPRTG